MRSTTPILAFAVLATISTACTRDRRHRPVVHIVDPTLETLDTGDLVSAEKALRAKSHFKESDKALLEAIHRTEVPDGCALSLLANVRARVVPRPPFPPAAKGEPANCAICPRVASRSKVNPRPLADTLSALGDPLYETRGARHFEERIGDKSEMSAALLRVLPRTYGGERLVMALPQRDNRWLLLFGTDMGKARYVVLIDPRASAKPEERVTAFDFRNFFEPPQSIAPHDTHELITWAEIDGDHLFVANAHSGNLDASRGKNAYITAVDVRQNAVIWRSAAQVASEGSFVLTDHHVICGYEDFETMRLFTLDRETGKTLGALALPTPATAIWVRGGKLMARAHENELTLTKFPGLHESLIDERRLPAIDELVKLAPPPRLPTFVLEPAAAKKRRTAIARLNQARPFEAYKIIRALVDADGLAGNFAIQTLLDAAQRNLDAARANSVQTVLQRARFVGVRKASGNRPAPIAHGPALHLEKVSEAKDLPLRSGSIFDERGIPPAEIDRPHPGHVGDLPEYVPAKLGSQWLFGARYSSSNTLVAVYGGSTVLFDTKERLPEFRFDFGALGALPDWPQVTRLENAGSVVIAAGNTRDGGSWFTAFDRSTGDAYWTTALAVYDMLLVDGWIVAVTPFEAPNRGYTTNLVVVDPTTGAVISSIHTVRIDAIARQGNEIIGDAPTSRAVFAMKRG